MLSDLVGVQVIDVGVPIFDQLDRPLVELGKVVRRIERTIAPVEPEPLHIFDDRFDVKVFFFSRIGIIEAQITQTTELAGKTKVETDGLGMPNVEEPVRLRWKSRLDAAVPLTCFQVALDDFPDEVGRHCRSAGRRIVRVGSVCFIHRVIRAVTIRKNRYFNRLTH